MPYSYRAASPQDVTKWRVLESDEVPLGPTAINAIVFSPDGTQLAVASVNGITVYDTYTGEALALLPSLMGSVTALTFSPTTASSPARLKILPSTSGTQTPMKI